MNLIPSVKKVLSKLYSGNSFNATFFVRQLIVLRVSNWATRKVLMKRTTIEVA